MHQINFSESCPWKKPPAMSAMSFSIKDAKHVLYPHDGPLVVTLKVANYLIHRILVDGGSSGNILSLLTFEKLMTEREHLQLVRYPVIGFMRSSVKPEGIIKLPVRMGENEDVRDAMVEFLVVDVSGAYNTIVGRSFIHDVHGVVSTHHLTMLYACFQAGYDNKDKGKSGDSQIMLLNGFEATDTKDSSRRFESSNAEGEESQEKGDGRRGKFREKR